MGVTNRIRAGSAKRATIIRVKPVMDPIRAFCPPLLPMSRNATE
jgi:hypothetical protein